LIVKKKHARLIVKKMQGSLFSLALRAGPKKNIRLIVHIGPSVGPKKIKAGKVDRSHWAFCRPKKNKVGKVDHSHWAVCWPPNKSGRQG
jgi:hypothetical protein